MERNEIFKIIEDEREYQNAKWGTDKHPMPQFLIDFEFILNKAKEAAYNLNYDEVMHNVRKITALGVKMGEVHGMPYRPEGEKKLAEYKQRFLGNARASNINPGG